MKENCNRVSSRDEIIYNGELCNPILLIERKTNEMCNSGGDYVTYRHFLKG